MGRGIKSKLKRLELKTSDSTSSDVSILKSTFNPQARAATELSISAHGEIDSASALLPSIPVLPLSFEPSQESCIPSILPPTNQVIDANPSIPDAGEKMPEDEKEDQCNPSQVSYDFDA